MLGTGADFHINSPAAVAQAVRTRLRLLTGEWFLDTSEGTPWMDGIHGKGVASDALLKERILNTPGVTELTEYSSSVDPATRKLAVNASIRTIYGATALQATV